MFSKSCKTSEINKIGSKTVISNIKNGDQNFFQFSVICPSKVFFFSGKNLKIKSKIVSKKNVFSTGNFRPNEIRLFALCGSDKKVDIIDFQKNKIIRSFYAHEGKVNDVCFSENKINVLSGGDDKTLRLWDLSTQKCISTFYDHKDTVSGVSYFPYHQNMAATSSYDGKIRIFDFRYKHLMVSFFDHKCPIEKFKFSQNKKDIVTMGGVFLKIWNLNLKKEIFILKEKKPILSMDCFGKECILYSNFENEIKNFNLHKHKIYSVSSFKFPVICISSSLSSFALGLSNGSVCIKRFCLKIFIQNQKLSKSMVTKNQDIKNFHTDSTSNFFYYPSDKKKKKKISEYSPFKIFSNNSCRKKKKKIDYQKNSFRLLIKQGRFLQAINYLLKLKKPHFIFCFSKLFKEKNIFESFIPCFQKNFLEFFYNLFKKNCRAFSFLEIFLILKKIIKRGGIAFNGLINHKDLKKIFVFLKKNKIKFKIKKLLMIFNNLFEFI